MLNDDFFKKDLLISSPKELSQRVLDKGYSILLVPVFEIAVLHVVRVYMPEATQPDERLERISKRLEEYKNKLKLDGFYTDPILT